MLLNITKKLNNYNGDSSLENMMEIQWNYPNWVSVQCTIESRLWTINWFSKFKAISSQINCNFFLHRFEIQFECVPQIVCQFSVQQKSVQIDPFYDAIKGQYKSLRFIRNRQKSKAIYFECRVRDWFLYEAISNT